MIQHGVAPFLECSSHGDRRFSAFSARIRGRGGLNIEYIFQAAKVFSDGSTGLTWREAKGRQAVNQEECVALYSRLWREYIAENPHFLEVLKGASGLSDIFGQAGHCCQATELWHIRAAAIETAHDPRIAADHPVCPKCGNYAEWSLTQYGARYDCRACRLWAWGKTELADAATHAARQTAHAAFDALWKSGRLSRGEAYRRLSAELKIPQPACHMKTMDAATARRVPDAVRRIRRALADA